MRDFHREFFKLAGGMLGCRLQCLGGDVESDHFPARRDGDWIYALLGYIDHAKEMELLCQETISKLHSTAGRALR